MSHKILYLSRIYPNNIVAVNGLWVEGMVTAMSKLHEVRVVSPVPYCPPLPESTGYANNRKILSRSKVNGVEVYRPRFLSPPGYILHSYLGELLYWSIVWKIDRYRKEFPFELIHAHFSYPEGYVAARLARRYNIPLIITEHATWKPWMDDYPRVAKQAVFAAGVSHGMIAASRYLADTMAAFTGEPKKLHDIPIGVNTALFKPDATVKKVPRQILYVGRIHKTKGVDILFNALSLLLKTHSDIHLIVIGGNLGFKNYQKQENEMRALATRLNINSSIEFVGMQPPETVVKYMQQSALLVLPSRRETFGAVLIEAIASGTPVVATRCGGPDDFVTDSVGALVDKENSQALADGIEKVMLNLNDYPADILHKYADEGFSWDSVARRTNQLYDAALSTGE
ncbi:Putative teichuronic acid biosynthesis glycosyl transferase TuaC [hydrothermal vent metagenome]|uniref:Teichuronic acid biosynthesis glycosyl transferase TuaC n=1 Tax=hydrothermal vent metagenome TaxID=652676 RepID=A0A3B0WCV0_9ZZZZ